MADAGINIGWGANTPAALVAVTGARLQRVVARREIDLTSLLRAFSNNGIRTLMVYDRGSFQAFGSVEPEHLAATAATAFAEYARRYNGLVFIHQPANEPDGEGESSWGMSQADVVTLGRLARQVWPDALIATPGLVSGQPSWLDGVPLEWASMVCPHPYGKQASPGWPSSDWGTGPLAPLLDAYAAYGKPLLVSEIGLPVPQVDEAFQAEYCRRMMATLNARTDVLATCWFALTDDVPGFGLYRSDGSARPAVASFKASAATATPRPWPTPGGVPPVEPPKPALPDPWQWWTAPAIAQAAQCPLDAVRDNWPRLTEQLHHCGLTDQNIWLGMIGTIAIESASTFRPVREAFYLGEPEPAESHRKTLRYYPYYGRGFIQNTWRDSYAELGPKIAQLWGAGPEDPTFDLVSHPDNLLDPDMSAAAGAIFFRDKAGGALANAARAGNWNEVRRLVLGGPDPQGVARITRVATMLGPGKPTEPPVEPPKPADKDELIAAYELALKTLRDQTLPAAIAANDLSGKGLREALRICEQMVGKS